MARTTRRTYKIGTNGSANMSLLVSLFFTCNPLQHPCLQSQSQTIQYLSRFRFIESFASIEGPHHLKGFPSSNSLFDCMYASAACRILRFGVAHIRHICGESHVLT